MSPRLPVALPDASIVTVPAVDDTPLKTTPLGALSVNDTLKAVSVASLFVTII